MKIGKRVAFIPLFIFNPIDIWIVIVKFLAKRFSTILLFNSLNLNNLIRFINLYNFYVANAISRLMDKKFRVCRAIPSTAIYNNLLKMKSLA